VIGIFTAISLLSVLFLSYSYSIIEGIKNTFATYFVISIITILMLASYFVFSRVFIKSTGVLLYDCLSLFAIVMIIVIGSMVFPKQVEFFYYPHFFMIIVFKNYTIGRIVAIVASLIATVLGIITKSGITRIM